MFYVHLLASKPYGPLCVRLIIPSQTKENAFDAEGAKGTQKTRRRQGLLATFAYPLRPLR